jgi:hypothetical protein
MKSQVFEIDGVFYSFSEEKIKEAGSLENAALALKKSREPKTEEKAPTKKPKAEKVEQVEQTVAEQPAE